MTSTILTIVGIVLSVVSAYASIVSTLVLRNLAAIDKRQDAADARQKSLEDEFKRFLTHKQDCQREFVTAEDFIRNQTYTRDKLDKICTAISSLEATIRIQERLPELVGAVVRSVIQEVKKHDD